MIIIVNYIYFLLKLVLYIIIEYQLTSVIPVISDGIIFVQYDTSAYL